MKSARIPPKNDVIPNDLTQVLKQFRVPIASKKANMIKGGIMQKLTTEEEEKEKERLRLGPCSIKDEWGVI